mgnify:CR=1 FL=1
MPPAKRADALASERRIVVVLALDCVAGLECPGQARIAARAGVAQKTVQRYLKGVGAASSRDALASQWDAVRHVTAVHSGGYGEDMTNAERFFALLDAADVALERSADKDQLQALCLWYRWSAAIALEQADPDLGLAWCERYAKWLRGLSGEMQEHWSANWDDRWPESPLGSITGCMEGLSVRFDRNAASAPARIQPLPSMDADPGWASRESSRIAEYLGRYVDPTDIRSTPGSAEESPISRGEREGYIAGLLFGGLWAEAKALLMGPLQDIVTGPVRVRAALIYCLGTSLLGAIPESAAGDLEDAQNTARTLRNCAFPDREEWETARELAELLAGPDQAMDSVAMHEDVARLQTWKVWIEAEGGPEPATLLAQVPLTRGGASLRQAVQRGIPWTKMPDLLPLMHQAAVELRHPRLQRLLQVSARAVLDAGKNSSASRSEFEMPMPPGLLAALAYMAVVTDPELRNR